jgi:hypothetical protein
MARSHSFAVTGLPGVFFEIAAGDTTIDTGGEFSGPAIMPAAALVRRVESAREQSASPEFATSVTVGSRSNLDTGLLENACPRQDVRDPSRLWASSKNPQCSS